MPIVKRGERWKAREGCTSQAFRRSLEKRRRGGGRVTHSWRGLSLVHCCLELPSTRCLELPLHFWSLSVFCFTAMPVWYCLGRSILACCSLTATADSVYTPCFNAAAARFLRILRGTRGTRGSEISDFWVLNWGSSLLYGRRAKAAVDWWLY
jgi:hypothetical protein